MPSTPPEALPPKADGIQVYAYDFIYVFNILEGRNVLRQLKTQPALIDQVHDQLVTAIVDGSLAEGEKLTQETVAERLGVSRQPVSHALQILKRRGLLIEHDKRSLAVAPMGAELVRNLYQVRSALDGLAASCAAKRVAAGEAPRADCQALRNALSAGQQLDAATALTDRVHADVTFHSAIHTLSGNPQIAVTVAEQWPHFMRSMGHVLTLPHTLDRVWQEHATIATAILDGDPNTASQAAIAHAIDTGEASANQLERNAHPDQTDKKCADVA